MKSHLHVHKVAAQALPKQTRTRCLQGRRGMTLIELMFGMMIMLILALIAIPTVRMLTADRQVNEASRLLNSFIAATRDDAFVDGRAGVLFERSENDPNKCTRIYRVKYPPAYEGDIASALCQTVGVNQHADRVLMRIGENSLIASGSIRVGDEIQIAGKGWWYTITGITEPDLAAELLFGDTVVRKVYQIQFAINPEIGVIGGNLAKYKFRRQPKKSVTRLDLPKGTFVDLSNSGLAVTDTSVTAPGYFNGGSEFASDTVISAKDKPVIVAFRSDGQIDKLYTQYYAGSSITDMSKAPPRSLFFLVGFNKQENDNVPINNLDVMSNLWVMVSRGTGEVTTSKMAVSSGPSATQRLASREIARQSVTQGGN